MIDPVDNEHLSDAPILVGLTQAQKHALLAACVVRMLKPGSSILSQGEPTGGAYLIASGRIEVSYVDSNGNEIIVHTARAGEMVGEIEALSGLPCAASCIALTTATVLFCPTKVLYAHIPPQILIPNLCVALYGRLQRENRNRTADHYYSAEQRLRMHLRQMIGDSAEAVQVSQSQLGVMIGCSRQTVNRMLGELRDEGIIEMSRNAVRVLDLVRLGDGAPVTD